MEKINVEISMLRHNLAKHIRLEEFWVAEVMVIIKYIWNSQACIIFLKKRGLKEQIQLHKAHPFSIIRRWRTLTTIHRTNKDGLYFTLSGSKKCSKKNRYVKSEQGSAWRGCWGLNFRLLDNNNDSTGL